MRLVGRARLAILAQAIFVKFAAEYQLSVRTVREKGSKSMGKNRKWVLEDKIQEAVWPTVLRGCRPLSAQWPRDNRSSTKANGSKADSKPKPKAQFQFGQFAPKTGAPPPLPEEVMSAVRVRVVKLRAVLETLGEDDEMYDTLKASLRKAEMKAQEPPFSEQISATRAFIGRKLKRVDEARQASDKARTALTEAVAAQEEQERLLADGERRLEELLLKERDDAIAILSSACSHRSRCSDGSCQDAGDHRQIAGRIGDDEVRSGLGDGGGRRRRRCGGWATTQKVSSWAQHTSRSQWWSAAYNTACHHRRARERVPVKDRAARYGLRGTRVGEASHPGPRRRQVIPSTDDDLDSTFLDKFELDLNEPTGSCRSPGAHEQMSPCGCPTTPEAFVLSDDEHLRRQRHQCAFQPMFPLCQQHLENFARREGHSCPTVEGPHQSTCAPVLRMRVTNFAGTDLRFC